jgi:hypothetical protein
MTIELENRRTWPEIGSLWRHHNGNRYRVIMITNVESGRQEQYPTTVVYSNVDNGRSYSRKLIDWDRSMTFTALGTEYLKLLEGRLSHE